MVLDTFNWNYNSPNYKVKKITEFTFQRIAFSHKTFHQKTFNEFSDLLYPIGGEVKLGQDRYKIFDILGESASVKLAND